MVTCCSLPCATSIPVKKSWSTTKTLFIRTQNVVAVARRVVAGRSIGARVSSVKEARNESSIQNRLSLCRRQNESAGGERRCCHSFLRNGDGIPNCISE